MSYIQSSPWTDAAEYGRALGDRLAEALISLPAIRAKIAMTQAAARQEQSNKERGFQLEEEKISALRENKQATNQYREDVLAERTQNDQAKLKQSKDTNTQNMMFKRQQAGVKSNQWAAQDVERRRAAKQKGAVDQSVIDRNEASAARTKSPSKSDMTKQIIQGAQALFAKYKNPGIARKYIKDNATANGLNIDPFAVSFDVSQGQGQSPPTK